MSRFEALGATVVAISVDSQKDSADLAVRLKSNIPLLSDPDLAIASAYGVAMKGRDIAVPATFVITPKGAIKARWVGESMVDRPDIDDILAALAP